MITISRSSHTVIQSKKRVQQYQNQAQHCKMQHTERLQANQKQKQHQPNHTRKLGNKQFAIYLKSQQRISTLIYNIEKYLSAFEPFYYSSFLSRIKGHDLDQLQILLNQQYNKLLQGKSFLQRINGAIISRRRCLDKIKRDLTKVELVLSMFKKSYFRKQKQEDNVYIEYTKDQGYTTVEIDQTIEGSIKLISNLLVDMRRFRDMTIYIIQTIHRWRVELEEWMDKCQAHQRVDYYVKNQDDQNGPSIRFYDIVQNDTDFLWTSKLCDYIWLQFKNDPLLIRNVINVAERQQKQILQKYFVQILYPDSEQTVDKTIRALDMLNHEYKPKKVNLYEQEQKLIQNYLSIQRKNNEQIGMQMQIPKEQGTPPFLYKSNIRAKQSRIRKSQSESKITVKKQFREEIHADNQKWGNQGLLQSPYLSKSQLKIKQSRIYKTKDINQDSKQNSRGWVFGKQLKKPASQKIREIIKKHEAEMKYMKNHKGVIKQFNISNYSQKNSIALAYISQTNNKNQKIKNQWVSQTVKKQQKGGQIQDKNYESDSRESPQKSRKKLYQSLVKINSIIEQDPKQHENDQQTPKIKKKRQQNDKSIKNKFFITQRQKKAIEKQVTKQELSKTINKNQSSKKEREKTGKRLAQSGIKINTIFNEDETTNNYNIQIQQEETPLNFKQFFQVFRADTKQKGKNQSRVARQIMRPNSKKEQVKQLGGSLIVRKIIDKKRAESLKKISLLPYYSKTQKKSQKKNTQKSKDKSNNQSFKSYQKVPVKNRNNKQQTPQQKKDTKIEIPYPQPNQHINLRTKQITKDLIPKYVNHICSFVPLNCQSFTNYHTRGYLTHLVEQLSDCTVNSLIFDIQAEKDGKIGQAVVFQSLSSSTLKMRYAIEFINVQKFQLLVVSVCKISEQLLSTTPCQEVILKFTEDKIDPVSTHFIALIDNALRKKSQKFCYFHILQKKILGLTNQDLYERVYVFQAKTKNIIKQAINQKHSSWRKRLSGSNFRSLVFQTKCVALSSNFKLRSQNLNKAIVEIYRQQSIGILYVILLHKIMTKYHLKQLKIASLGVNDADEITSLVKRSPFLRSVFYQLLQLIKKSSQRENKIEDITWFKNSVTKFTSMTDLLNYLSYKQYDQSFKFDFLVQSRFILNHQLTLSQINLSTSLDFVIQNSIGMLLLNNYKNFPIQKISRTNPNNDNNLSSDELMVNGYLLPSTEDNLKIFVMSAKEYFNYSDTLDLYSYLQLLFRQSTKTIANDIEQIAIPDLTKRKNKINSVKMFDGFLRLFPEKQFYSASLIKIENLWQNFYPNAVISLPKQNAIIMQYPIIVGFYDALLDIPLVSYALKQEKP